MSEARMRSKLVQILSPFHAIPVENKVPPLGTPDINFVGGWIECKRRDKWPVQENRVVTFAHPVNLNQKIWRDLRVRKGGTVILAMQVARDWLFFTKREVFRNFGTFTKQELFDLAEFKMTGLRGWSEETRQEFRAWIISISKG